MMSIVNTLPVTCCHCGEEIERAEVDGVEEWRDVRFSNEGGEGEYCAMSPYANHVPDRTSRAL